MEPRVSVAGAKSSRGQRGIESLSRGYPMLKLSVNPTTVPGGTTITGTAGVYLGSAVVGTTHPWTLTNYGALQGVGAGSYGVFLGAGGTIENAANGLVVGSIIGGYEGGGIFGAAGTLVNQGTISTTTTASVGVDFGAGGTITNGASGATTALISGGNIGIVVDGAPGTVTNFGRIEERNGTTSIKTSGVLLNQGGTITNN